MGKWYQVPIEIMKLSVEETIAIFDDATCNGFEFKVENKMIFYREINYNE